MKINKYKKTKKTNKQTKNYAPQFRFGHCMVFEITLGL